MGVDLNFKQGYMSFQRHYWRALLNLAWMHGWKAKGTAAPVDFDGEWNGDYFSNDGQLVTVDDARNLGHALELSLPDIPRHDAVGHKMTVIKVEGPIGHIEALPDDANPLELFSGPEGRQEIEQFIALCRSGDFVMW